MSILWLFNSAGWIFGPLVLLAGIAAVLLCVRATLRPTARRQAFLVSLSPLAVGCAGAIAGLILFLPDGMKTEHWLSLGKVILAGLVVSVVPLVWSVIMLRKPRVAA